MKGQDRGPAFILDLIDEAFDRRSWHGTNLRGSVRGITAVQAVHMIRGIAAHDLYQAGQIQLLKRLWPGKEG